MNTQTSKGGFDDVFLGLEIVSLVILAIVLIVFAVIQLVTA